MYEKELRMSKSKLDYAELNTKELIKDLKNNANNLNLDEIKNVKVRLAYITPDLAAEMLVSNTNNRYLNSHRVKHYQENMEEVRWVFNGATICFSENNVLLDGQHRLEAIRISKQPQWCLIVYGLKAAVFDTIDRNRSRSTRDILKVNGYNSSSIMASTINMIIMINKSYGLKLRVANRITKHHGHEITNFIKEQGEVVGNLVEQMSRYNHNPHRIFPMTSYCVFMYYVNKIDPNMAHNYIVNYFDDLPDKNFIQLVIMRDTVKNEIIRRKSSGFSSSRYFRSMLAIDNLFRAWNIIRQGNNIQNPWKVSKSSENNFIEWPV
jgi:hypothetical protein